MSLVLSQNVTAISYGGLTTSFLGIGGTAPYTYSILAGGAGGSIDFATGIYTSPFNIPSTPKTSIDTIQVVDSLAAVATSTISIGTALELLCDVLQNQLSASPMNLLPGRVYLWDQKINEPTDNAPWIAVSLLTCKPFGNNITYASDSGLSSVQSVNMQGTVTIDIISRGPAARDFKEFVLMALNSVYSEQQQEANSFYIGRIPTSFVNLSQVDGAALPYRYQISVAIQYCVTNNISVQYFNDFDTSEIVVNS